MGFSRLRRPVERIKGAGFLQLLETFFIFISAAGDGPPTLMREVGMLLQVEVFCGFMKCDVSLDQSLNLAPFVVDISLRRPTT